MSEKFTEYIGCHIKINCDKFVCSGEIVDLDQNTVVITNSSINGKLATTKFLGINHTLIKEMDIIELPVDKDAVCCISTALNVYKSAEKPPVIKRGGSASAVNRNLIRMNNKSQETIHKSKSSVFPENNSPEIQWFQSNSGKEPCPLYKNEVHKSQSFNFINENSRSRKTSGSGAKKDPSWLNYPINRTTPEFDFDASLAYFNKSTAKIASNSKMNGDRSSHSSDSGGIDMIFNMKNEGNVTHCTKINIGSNDHAPHAKGVSGTLNFVYDTNNEDIFTEPTALDTKTAKTERNHFKNKRNNKNTINTIKESIESTYSSDTKSSTGTPESANDIDIIKELKLMGILPADSGNIPKDSPKKKCDEEIQIITDNLLLDKNFLKQPDIVQEVTKSQLCNSETVIPEQSTILSVNIPSKDFQHFTEFWKLENNLKFPVFSTVQKDQLFDWANKFGYDVREIAQFAGKSLSEFVIQQVGGVSRLSKLNVPQIPKIAVVFGNCQTSVYVASMARFLVEAGCYVIAYYDELCQESNDDIEKELRLLNNTFQKSGGSYGFNYLTTDFKELRNKTFDYVITGLENDSNTHAPSEAFVKWSSIQKSPILSINPPNIGYTPWKVAAFVGVPLVSEKNLVIRTVYGSKNGTVKSRSDVGMDMEKMFQKPNGPVFLFDANLPQAVYSLLNLNYKSPFNSKNWLRLSREVDSVITPQ